MITKEEPQNHTTAYKADDSDWRTPLYESAVKHASTDNEELLLLAQKEFRYLGNRLDAREQCVFCEEKLIRVKKKHKQQRIRKKFLKIAAVIAAAAFFILPLLVALIQYRVVLPAKWKKVQSEEAAGDYAEALTLARGLEKGWYREQAKEKTDELLPLAAEQKLSEGRFEESVSLCKEAGEEQKIKEVYLAWGDSDFEQENYEAALEHYLASENADEKIRSTALLMAAEGGKENRKTAGNYIAETLKDTDSALRFCRTLYDDGWDLKELFPDGIEVTDFTDEQYMPDVENRGIETIIGKTLIFSRVQDRGLLKDYYGAFQSTASNKNDDTGRTFKTYLLVDLIFALPEERRAENLDECAVLLTADTYYRTYGKLMELGSKKKPTVPVSPSISYYPLFEAVDNVTFYDRNEPDRFYIVRYQITRPEAYQKAPVEGLENLFITEKIEDFEECWGVRDLSFLEETLREGVKMISEQ